MSKLLGEWFAAEAPRHYVLRVESLFGGPRAREQRRPDARPHSPGDEVRAFVDRTVSPSYVEDVVAATAALVDGGSPYGLYHCVNTGWTTWADLARELADLVGPPRRHDSRRANGRGRSRCAAHNSRPLSNAKLAARGIVHAGWQDALARYVASVS